jgi:hypothetical protein
MHITCPHCQNRIEVVDDLGQQEILCPSCGSSFHLESDPTTVIATPDGKKTIGKFELIESVITHPMLPGLRPGVQPFGGMATLLSK